MSLVNRSSIMYNCENNKFVILKPQSLQWRHKGCDGVSNHQPHDCFFGRRSKKASRLRVNGLCAGNSPVTAQMANNAEMSPFDEVIMFNGTPISRTGRPPTETQPSTCAISVYRWQHLGSTTSHDSRLRVNYLETGAHTRYAIIFNGLWIKLTICNSVRCINKVHGMKESDLISWSVLSNSFQ